MSKVLQKLLPWNWLKAKRPSEENSHKAKTATAGAKRKRDDEPEPVLKKQKLSMGRLQRAVQEMTQKGSKPDVVTAGETGYWTEKDYEQWMIGSGQLDRGPKSSVNRGDDGPLLEKPPLPSPQSMPPPATPARKERQARRPRAADMKPTKGGTDLDQEDATVMSLAPTTASKRRAQQPDAFDLELARRHAAAVTLPPNSGIWALSEKQLFYHLALRGFEPLLPQNWMVDFKTLPLSLFANEHTDPPLIQVHHGTTFRAVRALRSLIETGKYVRDKSLAGPNFHAEKTIEKSVKDYFAWALSDSGINTSHPDYLSTYTILTRKKGQTTTSAIELLITRLRTLASRHREHLGILPSIEHSSLTPPPEAATQVYDDTLPQSPPTLVGILIVSALVVVFTLNSYNSQSEESEGLESTGLRFIAKFDFSEHAYDVWNAIAVAIVAGHVRGVMEGVGTAKQKNERKSLAQGASTSKPGNGLVNRNGNESVVGKGRIARVKIKRERNDDYNDYEEQEKDGEDEEEEETQEEHRGIAPHVKNKNKGKKRVNAGWFGGQAYEEEATLVVDDNDPDL